MEDALKPLNLKGYGDVKILPYSEVIRLGEMSSMMGILPKSSDTAIIMYTSGSTGMLQFFAETFSFYHPFHVI